MRTINYLLRALLFLVMLTSLGAVAMEAKKTCKSKSAPVNTCLQCSKDHKKCTVNKPCDRCEERHITCEEKPRGKLGRPRKCARIEPEVPLIKWSLTELPSKIQANVSAPKRNAQFNDSYCAVFRLSDPKAELTPYDSDDDSDGDDPCDDPAFTREHAPQDSGEDSYGENPCDTRAFKREQTSDDSGDDSYGDVLCDAFVFKSNTNEVEPSKEQTQVHELIALCHKMVTTNKLPPLPTVKLNHDYYLKRQDNNNLGN